MTYMRLPKPRTARGKSLALLLISTLIVLSVSCGESPEEETIQPNIAENTSSTLDVSPPESAGAPPPASTSAVASPDDEISRQTTSTTLTSTTASTGENGDTPPSTVDTPSSTTETNNQPDVSGDLRSRYKEEIAELIKATERIRGLEFIEQPKVLLLDEESYRQRLAEIVEEEYSNLEAVDALYTLLGLMKSEDSLEDLYKDIFSQSASAYYDSDTHEVVVPISGTGFDLIGRSSMIHELVHALTDQHFDFGGIYDTLDEEYKYDQLFALQALVEGDAIQGERMYHITELTPEEQTEVFEPAESETSETAQTLPYFLEGSFSFPYSDGGYFVSSLLDSNEFIYENEEVTLGKGFYRAVNDAYENPPSSTEQIYQPEKYPAELPLQIEHPIPEIPSYELNHTSTWGSLWFSLMFDQVLETEQSEVNGRRIQVNGPDRPAVKGWGADTYSYWFDGTDAAFALTYRGDETADAQELFETMQEYVSAAMNVGAPEVSEKEATWQGEDFAWLLLSGDTLRFIAASDPEVGNLLVSTYEAL